LASGKSAEFFVSQLNRMRPHQTKKDAKLTLASFFEVEAE
jgi:hypothetical protein